MGPLGDALRKRRAQLNLTQIQTCELFGITQGTLSGWENKAKPGPEHFDDLARFLGYESAEDGNFSLILMRNEMWLRDVPLKPKADCEN